MPSVIDEKERILQIIKKILKWHSVDWVLEYWLLSDEERQLLSKYFGVEF